MDIESDDVWEGPPSSDRESGKIYVDRISHSRSSSSGKSSTASSTCSTPVRQGNGYRAVATVTGAFNNLLRSTLSSSALGKEKKAHSVESLLPQGGDISKMSEGSASDNKFSGDRRKSLGTKHFSSSTISIQYHKESSPDQNLCPAAPEEDRSASGESISSHNVTFSIEGFSAAFETDVKGVNSASTPISAFQSRKSLDGSCASRNSADTSPNGLQEQAFEKSLNNILEKCSENSLDLSLSIEPKDLKECRSLDDGGTSPASKAAKASDKKKKSSTWYSMLNPTYKSRSEDFKRLFKDKDIPIDERLIVDYSCAMQKEILVHGRMFITQNWICFYANIFRWETVLTISCKEIKGITKEKTARVIPNAIQITTDKEKFFFTSFSARDKTYLMLFRMWQNALLDQQMPPQELWHWVHCSYGEELGLTSSDEDYVSPPSMEDLKDCLSKDESIINKDMNTDSSDVAPLSDIQNQSNPDDLDPVLVEKNYEMIKSGDIPQVGTNEGAPTDMSDTTEEDNGGGEVVCSEHEHLPKLAHNEVYQMPVDKLFELILTDCPFFRNFTEARKLQDVSVGPWNDSQEDNIGRVRTIVYTVPLNSSFGPKTSRTEEKQICYQQSKPGMIYIIDGECYPMGIPYADSFYVVNRYCLTRVSRDKCRLRVTSEVRFKKTVLLVKSMIERNSIQGVLDFFECLGIHLRRECDRLKAIQGKPQPQLAKRKLRKRRSHTVRGAADLPTSRPAEKQVPPPTPIRSMISAQREEKLSKLNADTLVRIVCFILVLLVMFNALLFYKLWSLETLTNVLYFPHSEETIQSLQNPPKSAEEWMHLLQQQQFLHEAELEKWREVLATSVTLIDEMKTSLVHLKETLDHRLERDTYTRKASEKVKS